MDTTTPPPTASAATAMPPAASTAEDKTVAIVSYLTLIGFIVAIVLNSNKKTKLGAFHLRQALGLLLTFVGIVVCDIVLAFIPILGWLAILALWVAIVVLVILGLVSAIKGEMKPVPVIGPMYQKWFGTTFD